MEKKITQQVIGRLESNLGKIYLMGFFGAFQVILPVFVPLLQSHGLSMAQIMQTQSLFALVVAACEGPSGYLADKWGRKNTLLLGTVVSTFAYFLLLDARSFTDFLVFEALMGVAMSMTSGADLALIYDSQNALQGQEKSRPAPAAATAIGRLISVTALAEGAAALLTTVLLLWSFDQVLWVQALVGVMPVFIAVSLFEPPRLLSPQESAQSLRKVLATLFFENRLVLWTALAIVVLGLIGIFSYWIHQKYWELQGIPLAHFGYLWALFCLLRALAAQSAPWLERKLGPHRLFALITLLPLAAYIGMAQFGGLVGVCFGLLLPMMRGLSFVVFYDSLNRRVSAQYRATINSLVNLGTRAIFIVTGPVIGFAMDSIGIPATLTLLAVILAPLLMLVLYKLSGRIRLEQAVTAAAAGRS